MMANRLRTWAGFDAHIAKPFDPEELARTIQAHLLPPARRGSVHRE